MISDLKNHLMAPKVHIIQQNKPMAFSTQIMVATAEHNSAISICMRKEVDYVKSLITEDAGLARSLYNIKKDG